MYSTFFGTDIALLTCIYTAIFKRLLGLALPSAGWSYVVVYACFSLLLFLSYAPFLALFEASTWTALFCTTAGYTISNLATGVTELAATVQRFVGVDPSAPGVYLASNALAADGLPVTTKEDQVNHGFGTRSMQAIAKKYGGTFSVKTGEDTFAVDVMIPLA